MRVVRGRQQLRGRFETDTADPASSRGHSSGEETAGLQTARGVVENISGKEHGHYSPES